MQKVLAQLLKFRHDRNWERFHTPQAIVHSIVLESAELLEIFQWKNSDDSLSDQEKEHLSQEMADIYNWLILLAHDLEIDLNQAALNKIKLNIKKYPLPQ
ncbi:MAG TPA: nucleotide pyrophosphohydrolase [Candidatus Woesebacteria bacterium]|nr:nucleotide pyrophosphohydrolase [Candidatus Woesebacteria bacterium]